MDKIHSATEGVWNGVPVSRQDMSDMADNFAKFSSGPNPYYQPFLNLNHEDHLNSGLIVGAKFDGNELHLDGDHIPEPVGAWANGKRFHGASIEFWEPKWENGQLVGTFMQPDGNYCPTKVIKCLSLLGNQAPGMKGMSDLPVARFSDSQPTGGSAMSRDDLIAALAAMGFDQTKLTDLDTLLQYLVDCKAKPADAAAPAASGDPAEGQNMNLNPVPMADLSGVSSPAPVAVPSIGGGAAGAPAPTSLTLKFNDQSGKPQTGTIVVPAGFTLLTDADRRNLTFLATNGAAVAADIKRQRDQSKTEAIKAFGDRMAAVNVPPAQIKAQQSVLFALPHDTVRKFADGKGSGTALEEAIRNLEAGAVPGKDFNEKMKQGTEGTQTSGGGNGTGTSTDWAERKKKMLGNDPLFRAKAAKAGK